MIRHTTLLLVKYLLLVVLVMVASLAPGISPTQAAAAPQPQDAASPLQDAAFTPSECLVELPPGVIEGEDVVCGYLPVPEELANPDGPTIQLAVVIIKSKNSNPSPDPLFMAQGGPGGSTIDTYTSILISDPLTTNRDIVLFDQRGTMYSEPALMCEEITQLTLDTLEDQLTEEDEERLYIETLDQCRERLVAEGVNLSAFDSLENAADIEALRQALGYEEINLYGVSYGTLLALHAMRDFPQNLRSVILDGVVPTQNNFIMEVPQSMDRSFTRLFSACANDPQCNAAYPDLENVFYRLVDEFNETPFHVELTDPDTGIAYNAVMDGDDFQGTLFQMLYATYLIPALPRMIYDADLDSFDFLGQITSFLIFDRTMSYGMYYSVVCAEETNFNPDDQDLSGVRPQTAEFEERTPYLFQEICRRWDVEPLGSLVDQPVVSDIPTLVLSGGFDPITPPGNGEAAAASLENSYVVVFPAGGHGAALDGECQATIIQTFLDDPSTAPDAACIAAIQKPVFITPETVIDVPVVLKLLNLEENTGPEFLLLVLALLVLLSALLVFPVVWLVRYVGHKSPSTEKTPHPFLVRAAPWLAGLNGLILLGFLAGLIVILLEMVMKNDNRLFFGVTASASAWFVLPVLAFLLTLAMFIATLQTWRGHAWSIWGRLYYSLLTFSALACLLILSKWGLVTALI